MKLYIVRHGESIWNIDQKIQGRRDVPLSKKGIEEAEKIAPMVDNLNIDIVISSPLSRAYDTARIITRGKLPINTDDRLIERSWGIEEGVSADLVDFSDLWNFQLNTDVGGIETVKDLMFRVSEFLEDIKNKYKDKNVLISTHSAVMRAFHYLIEGIPEDYDLTKIELPTLRIIEYDIEV